MRFPRIIIKEMKTTLTFFTVTALLLCTFTALGQDQLTYTALADNVANYSAEEKPFYGDNGFKFETFNTGINSKYSDYGIGFFREKFISFSARKIGGLAKKDPISKEPYTKLYCSDITYDYDLKRPLLFSSILNRNDNLGTLAFSQDGNTLYFTQSKEDHTQSFELYRAEMNPEREGEWINITALSVNGDYSVENPHLSRNGEWLYFSSNKPEAIGGFDIFRIAVKDNELIGKAERIEGSVNTVLDEKFPQTSLDGKYLYFSSKGHDSQGGYDIFRSRKSKLGFVSTRNLGSTINSPKDEVAFIQANENIGYMTSNRDGGNGGYDIYKIEESILALSVAGKVIDAETEIALANATVALLDDYGEEVASVRSNIDGSYNFPVEGFVNYTVIAYKDGFETTRETFNTAAQEDKIFVKNLILEATPAPIVKTAEKTIIKIDNILFDLDSAKIKEISTITLNTVVATLKANPELKIAINAHTDAQGSAGYNKRLSMRRAASAMEYLLSKGISKDRLSSQGFGEEQLLINCTSCTPQENELNRRIEFIVISKE